jgi:large subunit ribosomal protein L10
MRAEKASLVSEMKAKVQNSPFVLVTDYSAMNVIQFAELRKRLRGVGARFTVVKNTVFKVAIKEAGLPAIDDYLAGQTAVVSGEKDVCAAAKVLKTFASEFKKPAVRGGVLDNAVLDAVQVQALADLPSREALLAQILGLLNTPATQLARILGEPGSALARVVKAKSEAPAA